MSLLPHPENRCKEVSTIILIVNTEFWPSPPSSGFPGGASGKESACQCKRPTEAVSIPGLGRSPGVGNGNPLQCSCLQNSLDRGAKLQSMGLQRVGHDWAHTYTHSLFFIDDHGILFYLVSSSSGLVEDFLLIVFLIFLYSCYNFILYFLMWDWSVALVLIEV